MTQRKPGAVPTAFAPSLPGRPATYWSLLGTLDEIPDDEIPCRDADAAVRGRWTSEARAEQLAAMRACADCPIQKLCRTAGVGEKSGVWGGVLRRPWMGKNARAADRDAIEDPDAEQDEEAA